MIIPLFHLFTNIFLKFLFSLIMPTAMLDFCLLIFWVYRYFGSTAFILSSLYNDHIILKTFCVCVCVCVRVSVFLLGFFDDEICSTFCFRVLKKGGKNNDGENYQVSFFLLCFMYVLIVLTVSVLELNKFWYQFLYWKNRNSLFW